MELFKLLGTIAIDNTEANKAIDSTTERAEGAHSKISSAFSKIGSAAVKVGKTVAVGLGAASTAIGAVAKSALDSYADYEQLVGGVETLFADSAKKVKRYADEAYQTTGLSANEYMETVTSFSASLLQGLGGDTDKAAKIANRAITDMSDNANKMGTDMSMIQNAYQGFAKQNYTMLDNLKLGYGGTAGEMARLINDSGVLGKKMKVTAKTVNEVSFDKIIEAIGVVQDRMGITGTTAKEASETISGSIASMKASWKNLLSVIANDDLDIDVYINGFVASVSTVLDNVIPRIKIILGSIVTLVNELAPKIAKHLPSLLKDLLPSLIQGAVGLFNGFVSALPTILQIIIEQIPFIVTQIGQALMNAAPILFGVVQQMMGQLWDYVSLELLNTGVSFEEAMGVFSEAFSVLWTVLDTIWTTIGQPIWDMISFAVGALVGMFEEHMPEIQAFFRIAISGIKDTWEKHLKPVFEAIGAFLNDVVKPAFEYVFKTVIKPLIETVFGAIADLWHKTLKPVFDGICDFITGVFTLNFEKAFGGLSKIVAGVFEGIKTLITKPIEAASKIIKGIVESIKGFFNFKIELPKIKLPHFSIKPKGWELGDLLKGKIPSLGIDWYAKAMDNPMVMTKPTAFGINGNGQIMAGGEKGSEVVSGTDTLMNLISSVVAENNAIFAEAINGGFDRLLAFLQEYIPELANMQMVTDTGALVGELAPAMDARLGKLARRNGRGVW